MTVTTRAAERSTGSEPAVRPLRVLLVDARALARAAAGARLRRVPGIEVAAEGPTLDEAVAAADGTADVAVVGVDHADGAGPGPEILARHPDVPVLILTAAGGRDAVMATLAAGASGYVRRDTDAAEMARVIRTIAEGGTTLHPAVKAWAERRPAEGHADEAAAHLEAPAAPARFCGAGTTFGAVTTPAVVAAPQTAAAAWAGGAPEPARFAAVDTSPPSPSGAMASVTTLPLARGTSRGAGAAKGRHRPRG